VPVSTLDPTALRPCFSAGLPLALIIQLLFITTPHNTIKFV